MDSIKHKLLKGFLHLPEVAQERILDLCPVFSCAISIALNKEHLHDKTKRWLNKWNKKLEAYKTVRNAFLRFNKPSEYRICKFITFVVIDLDDLLDENLQEDYNTYLLQAKSKLRELLGKEKVGEIHKKYIIELFDLIVKDIEVDSDLNNCDETQQESLDKLRENGYPSTLVGAAICLGLMSDDGNYKYDKNEEFKALIDKISELARICDDVVSDIDARNLVWKVSTDEIYEGVESNSLCESKIFTFKDGVDLDCLSHKINELKAKIDYGISQLGFNENQKQFVGSVGFYYLEYLKKWLGRQDADLLIKLKELI